MKAVDLNCDLAELEDESDLAIMPYISSCNIACGGHAGSERLMNKAVQLAIENKVTIGAHPGYPDRENFGRVLMKLAQNKIQLLITEQVGLLQEIAKRNNTQLKYLKLHGALYHDTSSDEKIAQSVIEGIREINPGLAILGPPDSALEEISKKSGFYYYHESFIDRRYQQNGRLVPRSQPNAVLEDINEIESQLKNIVLYEQVETIDGDVVKLNTDSICIHGDHPGAIANVRLIGDILDRAGVKIKSFVH